MSSWQMGGEEKQLSPQSSKGSVRTKKQHPAFEVERPLSQGTRVEEQRLGVKGSGVM